MNEHQKWLARRTYYETFGTPTTIFPNWEGIPNRCKCGCEGIWYDRSGPVNWWKYLFNPMPLFKTGSMLFPFFRALHSLVWQLPSVIWMWFTMLRAAYPAQVIVRAQPSHSKRAAIVIANVIFYGVVAPLTITLFSVCWCLSRLGSAAIMTLHLGSLVLLATLVMIYSVVAAIAISMRGVVFIIGGVASIAYSYYPIIGIALIVAGVLAEYERIRRNERRQEEIIGQILLSQKTRDDDKLK